MNASTMLHPSGAGKTKNPRTFSVAVNVSTVARDRVLVAVGNARRSVPLKAGRVAEIMGTSDGHESKIRSGERLSPSGRAALAVYEAALTEACPMEAAGQCSAFIEFTLRSIAMWPELEKLSSEELHAELRKEIVRRETQANSLCNQLEVSYLDTGKLPAKLREAMLEAHAQQGTSSIRIEAILQIIGQREG